MKLLLDTHILLWALADDPRLSARNKALLQDADTDLYVSAVSIWEVTIKRRLGKLDVPKQFAMLVAQTNANPLKISWQHGERAGDLPLLHNDPFDRLLIAQAQIEGMPLMTEDQKIRQYDVALV